VSPVYLKKIDSIRTKLTEEIDFEVCLMAIPTMALLQQHDGRWDILMEPAARACSDRSSGAFRTEGVRNWGRNRDVKTNRLVFLLVSEFIDYSD